MPDEFPYDVFLSHSAKDKAVVRASSLSASIPFSASDGEKVAEGRMRCPWESGERAGVRCRSLHLSRKDGIPRNFQPSTFNSQPPPGTFRFHDPLNKERRFLPRGLDDAPIQGSDLFCKDDDVRWQFANRTQSRTLATLRDTLLPMLLSGELSVAELQN